MAQVRVFQGGTVQIRPGVDERQRPAQFGTSVFAAGLGAAGDGLAKVAGELGQLEAFEAETVAKQADNEFAAALNDILDNPDNGFRNQRGQLAIQGYSQAREAIQKRGREIASGLPDGLPRKLFEDVARQRQMSAEAQVDRHFVVERETWADEVSQSRIDIASSDAGNAFDDPKAAEPFIQTVVAEIQSVGARKGWSTEQTAAKVAERVSGIRRAIAGRLGDLDPELAAQYRDLYGQQLMSDDADAVDDVVRIGRARIIAEERRQRQEADRLRREEAESVSEEADDMLASMERGNPIDGQSVERKAARLEELGKSEKAERLRTTAGSQQFVSEAMQWGPAQLQNWINSERQRLGNQANAVDAAKLTAAEKLLGEMKAGLKTDSLSWAIKAGTGAYTPLDISKPATIKARVAAALAISTRYGTKPTFLTDEETATWSSVIEKASSDEKVKMAGAIVTGFGRHSRSVLDSLSKNDPVFAHAAALSAMGGYRSLTARRIFAGQEALRAKAVQMPEDSNFEMSKLGQAMNFTPKTRGAVLESARALYAQIASERGLSSGTFAANLWYQALNRAAGATYTSGDDRVGGFGRHRGVGIVLPTDVAPDEFSTLVGRLDDRDLKAIKAQPRFGNGKSATAEQVRNGYLFDAGDGRYYVSLNRIGTQFLLDAQGRQFVLNLGALTSRLRARR